jgi:hypothetical protein
VSTAETPPPPPLSPRRSETLLPHHHRVAGTSTRPSRASTAPIWLEVGPSKPLVSDGALPPQSTSRPRGTVTPIRRL